MTGTAIADSVTAMSEWTLGAVRARNMQLEAACKAPGCGHFYAFNLDGLIASVGADYPLSGIPPMTCTHCGGPLKIEPAMPHPEPENNETEHS
jgi:hypothetical protein